MTVSAMPRRWFRFGLRTFFVLLTLFGIWLAYHAHYASIRQEIAGLAPRKSVRVIWKPSPWAPSTYWQTIQDIQILNLVSPDQLPFNSDELRALRALAAKLPENPPITIAPL